MSGWIPLRLRALLGSSLDDVDSDRLGGLIGLPEDHDLEFKREEYERTEGGAKEAAYDLAALANAGGGLLLIGVDEDGAGSAAALRPVSDTGRDVGLWTHQVVAARVFPTPRVTHRSVPAGEGFVHVIAVSPGQLRPHGVSAGGGALRFPMRTGTTRRFLTEPDVADMYRNRFAGLDGQDARVDELHESVNDLVSQEAEEEGESEWAWLVMACVPETLGGLELRRGLADEWKSWVDPALREFPAFGPRQVRHASVGFRSIELHDGLQFGDRPYSLGMRLHLDGSGVAVFGHPGGRGSRGIPDGVAAIFDEHLLGDVVNGVGVLARHAIRAGAVGTALMSAQVQSGVPMVLAQYRSAFGGVVEGTRQVNRLTGLGPRSTVLEAVAIPSIDTIATARSLTTDVVSSFGLAEPQQITADLDLVTNRFHRDWQDPMARWAAAAGVTVIDSY